MKSQQSLGNRLRLFGLTVFCAGAVAVLSAQTHPDWTLGPFKRPVEAPVITPNPKAVFEDPIRHAPVHWEALHTFNPAAVVRGGSVYVLYRAEDNTGSMGIGLHTSRLGLAESEDGIHFTRESQPVFYPSNDAQKEREWPGGTEDPRIVEAPDGSYVLTYTQWNRKTYTVGIATSKDLHTWQKHGPAFAQAAHGKYAHLKYKSAGILTHLVDGRLIAAQVHGKYWMYWGEIHIRLATSPDLIHWTPVETSQGDPVVLLRRRPGLFDSEFPEVGAPPLLTSKGIVLLYNGKNAAHDGAPGLDPGTYSGGQALFSAEDPARLVARTDQPYFKPEMPFEKSGQYAAGTTFVEGLVFFHDKWFLYYGCADSLVGVAVANAPFIASAERR
ncbi:MAG TPA: glycoside hydrolase family 130 protein [Acidobacteriaceae bacterium]|nr:glycoside hydrolase family 130 protein [Acidobacteriaceae bacterium]